MEEKYSGLIGEEMSLSKVSKALIEIGCSDMGDGGNLEENFNNGSLSVSFYDEETEQREELVVEFDVIKVDKDYMFNCIVKVTDIWQV